MDKLEFLGRMLVIGKIDIARYENAVKKVKTKDTAKDMAKGDKAKLTKAELIEIIEKLI